VLLWSFGSLHAAASYTPSLAANGLPFNGGGDGLAPYFFEVVVSAGDWKDIFRYFILAPASAVGPRSSTFLLADLAPAGFGIPPEKE
jgi:hypothetical protein